MNIYGPIPSRRLGKSLGINNIPYKRCSYSCVYCQVGRTKKLETNIQPFHNPDKLLNQVKEALRKLKKNNEIPDYLTFVPDGEPTLDENLGILIEKLKPLNIPVAVISNASLISLLQVQQNLMKADYVSLKIDAITNSIWKTINHPHKSLNLNDILDGITTFATYFTGTLTTETMLINGMNDSPEEMDEIANFISVLNPDTAYIAIPTRPPAYTNVEGASEIMLANAFHQFNEKIKKVELLSTYEGNAFSTSGNITEDLLKITSVHPMREEAIKEILLKTNSDPSILDKMLEQDLLKKVFYQGNYYYIRNFTASEKL